ncbi:hypothetical protein CR513_32520, partial [Mucuna pruriens]
MKRMLLEKFFSASRTVTIRKEIYGIRQHSQQMLHEYWEGFNKGGELMDKTPAAAGHLISNMASNTQQFRIRGAAPS